MAYDVRARELETATFSYWSEEGREGELETEFGEARAYARKRDLPDRFWIYDDAGDCRYKELTRMEFKIRLVCIYHIELLREKEWAEATGRAHKRPDKRPRPWQ